MFHKFISPARFIYYTFTVFLLSSRVERIRFHGVFKPRSHRLRVRNASYATKQRNTADGSRSAMSIGSSTCFGTLRNTAYDSRFNVGVAAKTTQQRAARRREAPRTAGCGVNTALSASHDLQKVSQVT